MKLSKNTFNHKQIEEFIVQENKFITDLFSVTAIPQRRDFDNEESEEEHNPKPNMFVKKTSRAKSLQELQQRLQAITSKKKLSYKEKLTKKGLKKKMKKKNKQDERNAKQKLARSAKITLKSEIKSEPADQPKTKPVFNSDNKMVFSKIDFADIGKRKNHKEEKDPKKLLKKLEQQEGKIQKLKESGDVEKAKTIKESTAWKNVLAKAEGRKVKDDPLLLKKSVQKREQKKRSSKKKWENRLQGVQKAKEERQQKRTENIDKRKKVKKMKKLKKASKKGKIIPGF